MSKAGSRTGGYMLIVQIVVAGLLGAAVIVVLVLQTVSARERARAMLSCNNMKQIALAGMLEVLSRRRMASFSSPPPFFDGKRKAASRCRDWRVHLLPSLEQSELYKQFHLDEPWDSPHNRSLIARMPPVYDNPNRPKDGKTNYLVPVGRGTVFDGDSGIALDDIKDGSRNTVLLVEADEDRAVPWTKPDDLDVNLDRPMDGLGHFRNSGFLVGFCDASLRTFPPTINPEIIKEQGCSPGPAARKRFREHARRTWPLTDAAAPRV